MRKEIRELLQESGYQDFTLGNILSTFQKRYQGYMCGEPGFPHEMGVLLGYPVEDVRGFMEQNGQNALYQGYWKVYAHVPEKKRLFARYDMEKRPSSSFSPMEWECGTSLVFIMTACRRKRLFRR